MTIVGCCESLAGRTADALRHLGHAIDLSGRLRGYASEDSDFDSIRDEPGFKELVDLAVASPRHRFREDDMANTTRLEQAVEEFNRRDEGYFDLYTDDVAIHGLPGTQEALDKQGVTEFYRAFWSAFPDASVEPIDMFDAGDRVAVRLRVKGTHRGELMGVAASGNEIDVEEITIFKLDHEGRCTERWVRIDELGFLQQIGAMPVPAPSS